MTEAWFPTTRWLGPHTALECLTSLQIWRELQIWCAYHRITSASQLRRSNHDETLTLQSMKYGFHPVMPLPHLFPRLYIYRESSDEGEPSECQNQLLTDREENTLRAIARKHPTKEKCIPFNSQKLFSPPRLRIHHITHGKCLLGVAKQNVDHGV